MVEEFLEGNRRRYTATCGVLSTLPEGSANTFTVDGVTYLLTTPSPATFSRLRFGDPLSALESWVLGTNNEITNPSTGVLVIELDFPNDGRYTVGFTGAGPCFAYDELQVTVLNARARA